MLKFHQPTRLIIRDPAPDPPINTLSASVEIGCFNKDNSPATEEANAGPKRKHKSRSKGSRSTKSSRQSKSRSKRRQAREAATQAEEEVNLSLLKKITAWWKEVREELRVDTYQSAEMERGKLIPDWNISHRSSMLLNHVGQDSWELYNAAAFNQSLTLKCTGFQRSKILVDHKILDLRKRLSNGASREIDWRVSKRPWRPRLKIWRINLLNHPLRSVKRENKPSWREGCRVLSRLGHLHNRGMIKGHEEYLQCDKFVTKVRETRLQGVRNFIKGPAF
ncbi:UNVERIFIED_CONTAM: hypothetical protein Sindi_1425000 [Sesamum indicum]